MDCTKSVDVAKYYRKPLQGYMHEVQEKRQWSLWWNTASISSLTYLNMMNYEIIPES